MTNTALGAGAEKAQEIIFISEAHEKFYYEKLNEVRYQDVYHKALCYCLGINDDTRRNANRIDCMPSLGMITINAFVCADSILIEYSGRF